MRLSPEEADEAVFFEDGVGVICDDAHRAAPAAAAQCGNGPGGFENWKQNFAEEARGSVGEAGVNALMNTHYNSATISADRGQKSFHLSLEAFMAKRGASAIVARGRQLKRSQAGLFSAI